MIKRINSRISKGDLPLIENWIAENQSWCPATTTHFWFPHVLKAHEAEIVIFLGLFTGYYFTEEIIRRLGNLAYQHQYSGEWFIVQKLLEQSTTPQTFVATYLLYKSEDTFFGNFLPQANKFLRRNLSAFKSYERQVKVKEKVRRRGYQDKGSLRPFHTRGRNLPGTPGIDRRSYVYHPLNREKTSKGFDDGDTSSLKEEEEHVKF